MKKYMIASVMALLLHQISFSQIREGAYTIGGSTSFNFNKPSNDFSDNYNFSFGIQPEIGRFLSDKWHLGGGIGYSISHYSANDNISITKSNTHDISGYSSISRFFEIFDKLYFTLSGNLTAGYILDKSSWEIGGITTESTSNAIYGSIGATPGIAWAPTDFLILHATVGYLGYRLTHNSTSNSSTHRVGFNLGQTPFSVGVRYMFGGK